MNKRYRTTTIIINIENIFLVKMNNKRQKKTEQEKLREEKYSFEENVSLEPSSWTG